MRTLARLPLLALAACPEPDKDPADTGADDTAHTDGEDTADTADTADPDTADTPDGLLDSGFPAELDAVDGCSDTRMHAWDADGNVGLEVYRQGLIADAAAGPVDETLTLGVDDVTVFVEVADPVAINYCTDALSERTVYARYDAVSGSIRLTMAQPPDTWSDVPGSFELTDVLFRDADGNEVLVPSYASGEIAVMQAWGG